MWVVMSYLLFDILSAFAHGQTNELLMMVDEGFHWALPIVFGRALLPVHCCQTCKVTMGALVL